MTPRHLGAVNIVRIPLSLLRLSPLRLSPLRLSLQSLSPTPRVCAEDTGASRATLSCPARKSIPRTMRVAIESKKTRRSHRRASNPCKRIGSAARADRRRTRRPLRAARSQAGVMPHANDHGTSPRAGGPGIRARRRPPFAAITPTTPNQASNGRDPRKARLLRMFSSRTIRWVSTATGAPLDAREAARPNPVLGLQPLRDNAADKQHDAALSPEML